MYKHNFFRRRQRAKLVMISAKNVITIQKIQSPQTPERKFADYAGAMLSKNQNVLMSIRMKNVL